MSETVEDRDRKLWTCIIKIQNTPCTIYHVRNGKECYVNGDMNSSCLHMTSLCIELYVPLICIVNII